MASATLYQRAVTVLVTLKNLRSSGSPPWSPLLNAEALSIARTTLEKATLGTAWTTADSTALNEYKRLLGERAHEDHVRCCGVVGTSPAEAALRLGLKFLGVLDTLRDHPADCAARLAHELRDECLADIKELLVRVHSYGDLEANPAPDTREDEDHAAGGRGRRWSKAKPEGKAKRHPKATVAARMLDLIRDIKTHTWTIRQFAQKLQCSEAAVHGTDAWRQLFASREMARQERNEQTRRKLVAKKTDRARKTKPTSSWDLGVND